MVLLKRSLAFLVLGSLLTGSLAFAQTDGGGGGPQKAKDGLGRTWKGPSASVIGKILTRQSSVPARSTTTAAGARSKNTSPPPPPPSVGSGARQPMRGPASSPTAAVIFRPANNSGVAEGIANAFGSTPTERSTLLTLF